jgi:spore coat protein A, manganese oxidase
LTRRDFLKKTGILTAAAAMHAMPQEVIRAKPVLDTKLLSPFVDALPLPPIARSSGSRPSPEEPGRQARYYRIAMQAFEAQLHRNIPATRLWGYGASFPGPTIETRSGEPVMVEWVNSLPQKHFLPIDHNLHGAEKDKPEVRAVVHLHGAKTQAHNDGYPEDWYVPGKSAVYYYPNKQDAAPLWYHDHAVGINRLNIYAGLAGLYFVRDDFEDSLHLPSGEYEIPLVICDRLLDSKGQLYYPESAKPDAPWIPEFSGDILLVNGKILPYLNVEPRKYRFRLFNVSNSSNFFLSLSNNAPFTQIGTDQGLLSAPVEVPKLVIAPAERADLIIDFSTHRGEKIVLLNRILPLMQFRVRTGAPDRQPLAASLRAITKTPESTAIKTRMLSLDEYEDRAGDPAIMLLNRSRWHMPITERPLLDSVEIWNLINMTDDVHPIHLHLVRFQILDRRRFDKFTYQYKKTLRFTGPAVAPDSNEAGWKDTARAEAGMMTRIIVRFEGYPGRYVWHCHNLEHEDNEMMRPYEVVAPGSVGAMQSVTPPSIPMCSARTS